jgi:hypothetical protein
MTETLGWVILVLCLVRLTGMLIGDARGSTASRAEAHSTSAAAVATVHRHWRSGA